MKRAAFVFLNFPEIVPRLGKNKPEAIIQLGFRRLPAFVLCGKAIVNYLFEVLELVEILIAANLPVERQALDVLSLAQISVHLVKDGGRPV